MANYELRMPEEITEGHLLTLLQFPDFPSISCENAKEFNHMACNTKGDKVISLTYRIIAARGYESLRDHERSACCYDKASKISLSSIVDFPKVGLVCSIKGIALHHLILQEAEGQSAKKIKENLERWVQPRIEEAFQKIEAKYRKDNCLAGIDYQWFIRAFNGK